MIPLVGAFILVVGSGVWNRVLALYGRSMRHSSFSSTRGRFLSPPSASKSPSSC